MNYCFCFYFVLCIFIKYCLEPNKPEVTLLLCFSVLLRLLVALRTGGVNVAKIHLTLPSAELMNLH